MINLHPSYAYADIGLVPRELSQIWSRDEVDPSVNFFGRKLTSPLIVSPMRTVCGPEMCKTLARQKYFSFLPRSKPEKLYKSVEIYRDFISDLREETQYIGAAIGATGNFLEEFEAFRELGVEVFCIDVANGFHIAVKDAIHKIISSRAYNETKVKLITGCVASIEGYKFLNDQGVSVVRAGIGSGSACTTSLKTGIGQGLISILLEIAEYRDKVGEENTAMVIADGGAKEPGDLAKALACRSDFIVSGAIFSGTDETPGEVVKDRQGVKYKVYAGEASRAIRGVNEYIEGDDCLVPYVGTVGKILHQYDQGLRSALSYLNCKTIADLRRIPYNEIVLLSQNSRIERTAHLLIGR
jgi:IMP dehydrogenase/GMP reductase